MDSRDTEEVGMKDFLIGSGGCTEVQDDFHVSVLES